MSISRGTRLRLLRVAKGLEQKEAAEGIGISRTYLSMLEGDKKGTNLDHIRSTMERAARFYGCLVEYLLVETPQEYAVAFVQQRGLENPKVTSVGRRLRFVLDELQLRWGAEFTEDRVAEFLGIQVETLRGYKDDLIPMNEQAVLERLTALTGVPPDFFFPRQTGREDNPAVRRIIQMATENGIPVEELEHVIRAWIVARTNMTKPSE